jgi:hypothetical protein
MADDQKKLSIEITTHAELAGAQQLAESLEQSIGKAKALGKVDEVKKLSADLDMVRGSIGKANVATEAAVEVGDRENLSLREKRESVRALSLAFPGMREAAVMALNPITAAAFALGFALEKTIGSFLAFQKQMDEVAAAAAQSQFSEGIKKVGEDMETARSKAEAYSLALADIAAHETSIAQALGSQLQFMQAIAAARAAEANAAAEKDKAALARKAAAGEITPEQEVIAETANAIKTARDDADRKKRDKDDEVAAKTAALNRAELAQRNLNQEKAAANAAVLAAQKHRDRLKDFGPQGKVDFNTAEPNAFFQNIHGPESFKTEKLPIEDAIKKASKVVGEYEEKLEALRAKQAGLQTDADKSIVQVDIDHYENAKLLVDLQLNSFRKLSRQYKVAHSPEANQDLQDKEHSRDTLFAKGEDNSKEVDKLRRELDEARKTSKATQPIVDKELADRIATILEQAVTKLYSKPHGAEVETGVHIADQVVGGKQVGAAQAQFIKTLDTVLGGHAKTLKEAADHIEKYRDNTSEFFNAVITLTSKQQQQLDQLFTIVNNY